jgi:hypothetical protein
MWNREIECLPRKRLILVDRRQDRIEGWRWVEATEEARRRGDAAVSEAPKRDEGSPAAEAQHTDPTSDRGTSAGPGSLAGEGRPFASSTDKEFDGVFRPRKRSNENNRASRHEGGTSTAGLFTMSGNEAIARGAWEAG